MIRTLSAVLLLALAVAACTAPPQAKSPSNGGFSSRVDHP